MRSRPKPRENVKGSDLWVMYAMSWAAGCAIYVIYVRGGLGGENGCEIDAKSHFGEAKE